MNAAPIDAAVRREFPGKPLSASHSPVASSPPGYSGGSGAGGDHGVFE